MIDTKKKGRYIYITVAIKDDDLCEFITDELQAKSVNLSAYLRELIRQDMKFKHEVRDAYEQIKKDRDAGLPPVFKF